jgi:hypothetical protein
MYDNIPEGYELRRIWWRGFLCDFFDSHFGNVVWGDVGDPRIGHRCSFCYKIKKKKRFLCNIGIHSWKYEYIKMGYLQEYHRSCNKCNRKDAANMALSAPKWIKLS